MFSDCIRSYTFGDYIHQRYLLVFTFPIWGSTGYNNGNDVVLEINF
jgi:hypothetical protein